MTEPAPPPPATPSGPLEEALAALAAHGPADAAAATSLLRALAPLGTATAPSGESRTAEDAALAAVLEVGGVGPRERQAALAALRAEPRGPLGPPVLALVDAVAARANTPVVARDQLLAVAGQLEPLEGPGRATRLEALLRRATTLAGELRRVTSLVEDGPARGRLRALAPLLRALRRLDPATPPYEADRPDGPLFDLMTQVDQLGDGTRQELGGWVTELLPGFPEDPALIYAAAQASSPPPDAWRETGDRLIRALDELSRLPPTVNTQSLHHKLVNVTRFALQGKDNPGLLALLRREVGSPHAGPFVNLRLLEALAFARGSPDEARAAVSRLATYEGDTPGYDDFFDKYLKSLAPPWFGALPLEERPTFPLPEGMFFGARPGSYVLFGGEPEVARRLPAGLELVWLPQAGCFLGRADVTASELGAAGVRAGSGDAPARGLTWAEADGFVRGFRRDLRLPTPDEVEAATRAGAAAPPLLLAGPRAAPPDPDAGLRVALDGR